MGINSMLFTRIRREVGHTTPRWPTSEHGAKLTFAFAHPPHGRLNQRLGVLSLHHEAGPIEKVRLGAYANDKDDMGSGRHVHEPSPTRGEEPTEKHTLDEAEGPLGVIPRFGIGLISGFLVAGLAKFLIIFPLASRLEPWSVLFLANGLLLGPAGIFGSATAYFVITLPQASHPLRLLILTGGFVLMGAIAYAVFRLVPKLDRGLPNLRSYLGFLGVAILGSLMVSGIGSAYLFFPSLGSEAFWTGVVYWFSGAITSLLILAPFILVVAVWFCRPWLVRMPREVETKRGTGIQPEGEAEESERKTRQDIVIGTAMVLCTTAVVSPLVHLRPQFGGWLALLYLVPILWGSISRGLPGGVLVASASGVAYVFGSALSSTLLVRAVTHQEVLAQFAGLVLFSLVGAITGAFQQARLTAESALLKSNFELEKRHESLALVNRLTDKLRHTLDVEMIAQEAVEALIQLNHPPMVAVYLLDKKGSTLELKAQHGFDEATLRIGRTLPVEGSLSGLALSEREILVCEDVKADDRIESEMKLRLLHAGFESLLSIPMVFELQNLGTINLIYGDRHGITQDDLESFSTIGRTVALALVNARHVARLEHLAFHDDLTGLPNREGLHRWFSDFAASRSFDPGSIGLVVIDIDRFKEVNDALGHTIGDQVLTQIGPIIKSSFADRFLSVFRLAGDKFAIFLRDLKESSESEDLTSHLLTVLAEPFSVSGMALVIEASAGIAIYPEDGSECSELLRCADVAVNHAKHISKRIVRYSPLLDQHTPERLALVSELGSAVRDNQLRLHFQPKVTLSDGRPVGFEALVRWEHPRLGLLSPDDFIPLAEVGEMIHPLTYWVVENALSQLKIWQQRDPNLTMAINLSARNLLDRSCATRLLKIMADAQIDPRTVEFELTETALVIDPDAAATAVSEISDSGAHVVIDDFGTGYSSMAFLKRCPIHALKIDRSFVGDMLSDVQSKAIVRATVQLADDLGLAVIAEGIEDAGTVEALSEIGCHVGQGFYFFRPSAAEEVDDRLAGWGLGRA